MQKAYQPHQHTIRQLLDKHSDQKDIPLHFVKCFLIFTFSKVRGNWPEMMILWSLVESISGTSSKWCLARPWHDLLVWWSRVHVRWIFIAHPDIPFFHLTSIGQTWSRHYFLSHGEPPQSSMQFIPRNVSCIRDSQMNECLLYIHLIPCNTAQLKIDV